MKSLSCSTNSSSRLCGNTVRSNDVPCCLTKVRSLMISLCRKISSQIKIRMVGRSFFTMSITRRTCLKMDKMIGERKQISPLTERIAQRCSSEDSNISHFYCSIALHPHRYEALNYRDEDPMFVSTDLKDR